MSLLSSSPLSEGGGDIAVEAEANWDGVGECQQSMLATGEGSAVRDSVGGSEAGPSRLPEPWLSVEGLPLKPPEFANTATAATPIVTPMTSAISEELEAKAMNMVRTADIAVVV